MKDVTWLGYALFPYGGFCLVRSENHSCPLSLIVCGEINQHATRRSCRKGPVACICAAERAREERNIKAAMWARFAGSAAILVPVLSSWTGPCLHAPVATIC